MSDRPHNMDNPVFLRANPRCYLCGGQWGFVKQDDGDDCIVIRCQDCELLTYASFDEDVIEARKWK